MSIIQGVVRDGVVRQEITTSWTHDPGDPFSVRVYFLEHELTWIFGLDLLMEAFTSPPSQIHGLGDVQIELMGDSTLIHLNNGAESATVKFPSGKIQEFLNQIDDQGSEEFVAQELENFLEAL